MDRERIADFCRKHHIRRLALFGSMLRDDFRADSDVDVLVEFEEGHVPGFAFIDLQDELRIASDYDTCSMPRVTRCFSFAGRGWGRSRFDLPALVPILESVNAS
jgi:hypothetical protein